MDPSVSLLASAHGPPGAEAMCLGPYTLHPASGRVVRPNGVAHLEPRVMDVLLALVARAGRTVSRDELIDAVWGHPNVSDEALSRCVSLVRKALDDDPGKPRFVGTVPKRGYRFLQQPAQAAPPAAIRIAILPFLNLSGNARFQHFADGLTELLITYASSVPHLRVVSRTSCMRYRGSDMSLPDIARELSVTRIVEGSVIASIRAVQAVVQLIDTVTDTHLFAQTYRQSLGDPIEAQNDIASAMASALGTAACAQA